MDIYNHFDKRFALCCQANFNLLVSLMESGKVCFYERLALMKQAVNRSVFVPDCVIGGKLYKPRDFM